MYEIKSGEIKSDKTEDVMEFAESAPIINIVNKLFFNSNDWFLNDKSPLMGIFRKLLNLKLR